MNNTSIKKLPKDIIILVEKNNIVQAIKALSSDEGLSFDEAKNRIDAYDVRLKQKQQAKLDEIVKKQIKQSTRIKITNDKITNSSESKSAGRNTNELLAQNWIEFTEIKNRMKRIVLLVLVVLISLAVWQLIK